MINKIVRNYLSYIPKPSSLVERIRTIIQRSLRANHRYYYPFHSTIDGSRHQRLVADCKSDKTHVRIDTMQHPRFDVPAVSNQQEVKRNQFSSAPSTQGGRKKFMTTYQLHLHINRGKTPKDQEAFAKALKTLCNARIAYLRGVMELAGETEKRDQDQ
ncbi:MAG: hypothetical protein EOL88_06510 [Bacteroidia bacterium]|nr:hypothetical protein [Bacteroidia bacterium]